MKHSLDIGGREIAVLVRDGKGPALVWLGGFCSDMRATKAEALDAWAHDQGRRFIRFDYSGHGESGGQFEDGTISLWLEETLAVIKEFAGEKPVLAGSSMGGWLAVLAAQKIPLSGLVLIAPALDFTETLMWERFPDDIKAAIMERGIYYRPNLYSAAPYPITRSLIEDGRTHLLLKGPIITHCPVHILQGMKDPDVPWSHALALTDCLLEDKTTLTFIKNGDHRLSKPEDIALLINALESLPSNAGSP